MGKATGSGIQLLTGNMKGLSSKFIISRIQRWEQVVD